MSDKFIWFGPNSVQVLRDRLNAASPAAWLEVRGTGKKTTLTVREPGAAAQAVAINDAHVCPPATDCPPP